MAADFLDGFQERLVGLDLARQLGALHLQAGGVNEHQRIAGVGDGDGIFDPVHFNDVFSVAGRQELAGDTADNVRPIDRDLCPSAGDSVDGVIAVNHRLAVLHRNFGDKDPVAVGHTDAHGGDRLHRPYHAFVDRERSDRRRYVAAVVDVRRVDAHLAEGEVDIGVRPGRGRDDRVLARQDVSAAQTVDLAHVRAAIDGQYDRVSFRRIIGILVRHDKYTLAGAAAHYRRSATFPFPEAWLISFTLILISCGPRFLGSSNQVHFFGRSGELVSELGVRERDQRFGALR